MSGLALRTTPVTDEERAAAVERLLGMLPHLFIAANAALIEVPGASLRLGVVARSADGGGRVIATFEGEAFLRDLEKVVGPLPLLVIDTTVP